MDTTVTRTATVRPVVVINKGDSFRIADGPSRSMLFDACEYAFGESEIALNFVFDADYIAFKHYKILSISHEDGSGNSFIFKGECEVDYKLAPESLLFKTLNFEAYYNSRKRTGHLIITNIPN